MNAADIQINYSLRNPGDRLDEDILIGIGKYLERIRRLSDRNVEIEKSPLSTQKLTEKIFDIIVGTADTRRGPKPTGENRQIVLDKIKYSIENNEPVESRTSWGPHKHLAPGEDNMLDVSEVSAIEQFNEISQQIKRFYPKGMHFYIFLEDFEGKYIEGDAVDIVESMQLYIRSFKTLITILGLDDVFSMIATSSIPRDDEELLRWKNLLSQNFRLLRDYWMESEEKGLQGAEKYTSFKALRENGFYSLINREIRDYYISRLDKIFGSSISNDSKLEMILKDFAVALLHKQTKMFSRPNIWDQRINVSMVPVIPGTPNQLIMGRINLRPMSRKDSKLSMPPWTGKGFLRMKDDVDRPAMRSFRDFHAGTNSIVKGSIVLRRGDLRVEISADHLLEDAVV